MASSQSFIAMTLIGKDAVTLFQLIALTLTAVWLAAVLTWLRRSTAALAGGLFAIGIFTLISLAYGLVTPVGLGLGAFGAWWLTAGLALAWLGVVLAYNPMANRLAARWFPQPPTLEAFKPIQESRGKLVAGILAAWGLGGFLEELVARGIVLQALESLLAAWLSPPVVVTIAVLVAAAGAGLMHAYQGPRAMVIITQISLLFGVLFVASGNNLWPVILCHGLYDTIAFIRFASGKSSYAVRR